jgi:hypothetical protein
MRSSSWKTRVKSTLVHQPRCTAANPIAWPSSGTQLFLHRWVLTNHFLLWNVVCFYNFTDIEFVLNVLFLWFMTSNFTAINNSQNLDWERKLWHKIVGSLWLEGFLRIIALRIFFSYLVSLFVGLKICHFLTKSIILEFIGKFASTPTLEIIMFFMCTINHISFIILQCHVFPKPAFSLTKRNQGPWVPDICNSPVFCNMDEN